MELVTGHAGTDHISAADIASMMRGAYGAGDYVLSLDDDMSCTALSANTIEIGKGGCLIQGHFCRVETAEQVTVESGSPGYYRNDLIVARYTLGDGNIQDVYLDVVKGTPTTSSTPDDPAYVDGDIDGGSTLAEFPLWRIPISGVNVGEPERVMPLADAMSDQAASLQAQIESVRESVSLKVDGKGDGGYEIWFNGIRSINVGYWASSGSSGWYLELTNVKGQTKRLIWDCGGNLGPNSSYAARPKSLRYCMGLL